jgi:arylsulfatase A-like enzyme
MAQRPNLLYLHSHDTGRYVRPYGYDVPTPHLQQLADEGVLFRQDFCAAPTCSPSRAALLTGMYPHEAGMTGLAHRGWRLNDYGQHIIHTLHQADYHTALIGTQHIIDGAHVAQIGYDQAWPGGATEARTQAAVDFLTHAPPQPFFLSVGFQKTHRPFPEAAEDARYARPPDPLPDTPDTRRDMAAFQASARRLDASYGRILQTLDEADLAENTLVICTTDHGIAFPGMKCTLTDLGIGVLLIIRGPGGFHGGRVIDALVSHVDIFPTLCDLLDLEPPPWLRGASMLPLVRGEAEHIRNEVFAEVNYHAAYEPQRCVRITRYKYIRRFDGRERVVLPNCDEGPSKDVWLAHGWGDRPQPQESLFDLIFDPLEAHNLATDPQMQEVLAEMRQRLLRWMQATDDPLLYGPVPVPPGARVNDPDGLSPNESTQPAQELDYSWVPLSDSS